MDEFKDLNRPSRRRSSRSHNRENKQAARNIIAVSVAIALLLCIGGMLYYLVIRPDRTGPNPSEPETTNEAVETESQADPSETEGPGEFADVLEAARFKKIQYDYDGAVQYVKEQVPGYENYTELTDFISECMAEKVSLVKIDNKSITHVFFHILVWDEQTAFAKSNWSAMDYNTVMTTSQEFKDMMQEMYDRGYVMVSIHDIAKIETMADGSQKMMYQPIYLPEGKKAFVMSQDDVCYYDYMVQSAQYIPAKDKGGTYTGCATKLVINDEGKVVNEMLMSDGKTVEYGAFDLVPILDEFVEAHPDFAYKGHKATLALTGYNGILGYRTSYIAYSPDEILNQHYDELFKGGNFDEAHAYSLARGEKVHVYDVPDIEEQRAEAARVAQALLDDGYTFASHTWGHMDLSEQDPFNPPERLYRDTQWWDREVAPLIGGTDIIIFAYGGDMGWRPYSSDNVSYKFLKSMGFSFFCNVDASHHTWMQLISSVKADDGSYEDTGFYRMARRNLDGQRMLEDILYPEKERLTDLFDSKKIFSRNRPIPTVEDIGEKFIGVKVPEGYDPAHLFD